MFRPAIGPVNARLRRGAGRRRVAWPARSPRLGTAPQVGGRRVPSSLRATRRSAGREVASPQGLW